MTDRTLPESRPLRAGDPERLGAYEIIGRLGEGGQGTVFLGRRPAEAAGAEADFVAVKLLHAAWADDQVARGRFIRELEVAKRVARFCTAQILDADMAGDQPYIVSEFVPGPSLHHLVEADGPRSGGALERLAISTLTALTAIHQAGIVHRDFKPHNVLLGPDGPRVIDFGVARALDAAGETQVVGTPAYMAPEQFTAAAISQATDMFAWGVTMVFAATGRPAFGNDEMAAVMHRIITAEPDLAALPGALRDVVGSCLAKDPAARPSARQAQERLVGGSGSGTGAEPVTGSVAEQAPAAGHAAAESDPGWPQPAWPVSAEDLPASPFPEDQDPPPAPASIPAPASTPDPASTLASIPAPNPSPAPAPGGGTSPSAVAPPVHGTRPGPPERPGRRAVPAVIASAAAVGVVLAGGAVWAATMRGDDTPASAAPKVAVSPSGTGPRTGAIDGAGGGKPGSGESTAPERTGTAGTTGTGTSPGPGGAAANDGGKPGTGTTTEPPGTRPGGGNGSGDGGSSGGGGATTERENPYSATQVCGSGYYVQRSSGFSGGRTYQLYNTSTQKNCVVTLKTTKVGTAGKVWAKLEVQGGGTATDSGQFSYYAGPVYLKAPGKCVRYSGGTATGTTSAGWANCG